MTISGKRLVSPANSGSGATPPQFPRHGIESDLCRVDETLLSVLGSTIPLISDLARHLIASGGKRVRPIMTLLSTRACGGDAVLAVPLACAVELIHTATLLHDDVVDSSLVRRGRASANAVWGDKASVLVGDFLFSRAFQLMVQSGSLSVLRILSEASAIISEGEIHQLTVSQDVEADEETYLQIISSKTAALFAAACRIGPILAGHDEQTEQALEAYGREVGIAFQLIDDVLDYEADEAVSGKRPGNDLREGKVTLPVIYAYRCGGEQERAFWRRTLVDQEMDGGTLAHALMLLQRHGALKYTRDRAEAHAKCAGQAIMILPPSAARDAMVDMTWRAIHRDS